MRSFIFASVIGALLLVSAGTAFADPAPTPTPNACRDNNPDTRCRRDNNPVRCNYGFVENQFRQCVPVQPVVPQVTQCVGGQLVPQVGVNSYGYNGVYNGYSVGSVYYQNGVPMLNGMPYYGVNGYNGYNGINSYNGLGGFTNYNQLACVQSTPIASTPVTNTVYVPVPSTAPATVAPAAPASVAPTLPRTFTVSPPNTGDAGLLNN